MNIANEELKELLVDSGLIAKADFDLAVKQAKDEKKDITDVLVDNELIKDEQLGQLIAEELGFAFVNLRREKIDEELLDLVPELVARSQQMIVFGRSKSGISLAMTNPNNLEIIQLIEKRTGEEVSPYYVTKMDLENALALYSGSVQDEFTRILDELKDESLGREQRDEKIVLMVNPLLEYGYRNKASDIHIEPMRSKVVVRFRIDGVMHRVLDVSKDLFELFLTRIKILSKMRTDEHRAAQDGKLRFSVGEDQIDIRVSIVPIVEGENVVMRLLSSKGRQFSLDDLGLTGENHKKVKKASKNPHGMILVTGPTGSGKTTTLYAIMKILNKPEVHISTIEDPVEYDLDGVSQIQVNTKTNLTFAKGLRAIVRQDPDIIMVGEIRDKETASIAVNSALTGHLVLSTLHTNDAPTALPRLVDMGVEPFLIASTINIVVAQRLVRQLCDKCRESIYIKNSELKSKVSDELIAKVFKGKKEIHCYHSKGCKSCGNSGFIGRIGIFEVLEVSEGIRLLVIKNASSDEIMKTAKSEGMATMMEDGLGKVLSGQTTIDEVLRVAKE